MRIESDIKLDFSDVLLKPKRSTLESRKDVDLERTFHFRHGTQWTGVPIISSNMTSVTNGRVTEQMLLRNMMACLPKTFTGAFAANPGVPTDNVIPSFGMLDVGQMPSAFVCIDVPNGYMESVVELTEGIRSRYDGTLIVGNVVTAEQTEALILAGADIVKVGIGSGSACSTRIKTGVGMPQLSAVIECADAAHGLGGHIISDGGCTTPGDIAKAFASGADFVMLGGMLAGHDENAEVCPSCSEREWTTPLCARCNGTGKIGAFYGMSSERANNELSGGLRDYRASEGWEINLPSRGPLSKTLQDIEGGLRSACSYVGARHIKDLPKCATFVMVNRQANTVYWENRV